MTQINIKNLTFGYDGSSYKIFDDISVTLDTDWKLALAGRNGRGKTTFLRLLRGELPYEGTITGVPTASVFPSEEETFAPDWRVRKELNLMQADPDIMYRPFDTLSGGERTKLMLARLFSEDGIYPMIDEPTNHLDRVGREAVARYLASKDGFILISHDRHFLDQCTDHTLMITKTGFELTATTFSNWWDNNERRMESEKAQNEQLRKEIDSLEVSIRKNASWSAKAEASKSRKYSAKGAEDHFRRAYEGEKARKLMSLSKNLQRRNERKIEEKSSLLRDLEKSEKLKITGTEHHSRTPIIFKDLTLMRGENVVISGLDFEATRGSKISIQGPNGCGKSTLLKFILGQGVEEGVDSFGDIYFAQGLKISYVSQETSDLQGELLDIAMLRGCDKTQFSTILIKMGFNAEMLKRDAQTLSLGQKKCVMIALSLCEKADLYIWDEPLNYIDIYMRKEIERLVKDSDITLLFVEHDKAFSDAVADEELML